MARINEGFRSSYESHGILGPAGAVLKFVFYIIGMIVALGVLILVIGTFFFIINSSIKAQETGVFQTISIYIDTTISKIPIYNKVYEGARNLIKIGEDPSIPLRTITWRSEVDKSTQNKELGLRFKTELKGGKYLVDQPITLKASIMVNSLKTSTIQSKCISKAFKKDDTKVIVVNPESKDIAKGYTQTFTVFCEIPSNYYESKLLDPIETFGDKITLAANYEFNTFAYIPIYTMSRQFLENTEGNVEIKDSLVSSTDNVARSRYTLGPVNLALIFDETQPVTEEADYRFTIGIKKTGQEWSGRLSKVNDLFLYLPKNFELINQEPYTFIMEEAEGDLVKYRLDKENIEGINNHCDNYNLDKDECSTYWETLAIIIPSKFKITSLEDEDLKQTVIGVEADYGFAAESFASLTIIKTQEA